ncbi:DUF2116 family Zn-ribbon domain-containing protein [Klebsiella aerogenes]|uniref:DUF2116 family Zn-ribbon domain-containing protein n=1 Tax=Klebsiella aerogenes TaxID=548 RepID=UPI003798074A
MFTQYRFDNCPTCNTRISLKQRFCEQCGEEDPFGRYLARQERQVTLFCLVLILLFTEVVLQYTGVITLDLLASVFHLF